MLMWLKFNPALSRYWVCVAVHAMVVIIRGAMAAVWITKVEHKWTFGIDRLSFVSAAMNFITSVSLIAAILGLATWTMTPLAIHRAFTRQQTLTVLHDMTSACLGLGAAASTMYQNLNRNMAGPLVVFLVYFTAAWGVGNSFSSSFTLEAYNETTTFNTALNSITTALTKTADHLDLSHTQAGTAFFAASFETYPSLYKVDRMSGCGAGIIYDTLASPLPLPSRITVPAIAFAVGCGDVPQNNWTVTSNIVLGGLNVTVSAFNQRPLSWSGVFPTNTLLNQKYALYKFLEEADPSTASPSRNLYVLGFSTSPDYLPVDSQNSNGYLFSQSLGPITGYMKVMGCSITASNKTVIVDGASQAVNNSDTLPPPDTHLWSNVMPLPSRGSPFEDSFSALYGKNVAIKIQRATSGIEGEVQFSLFEELLIKTMSFQPTLQNLEFALSNVTGMSYGALGQRYPYTNITNEMKQAGWDSRITFGAVTSPALRARLNLSGVFTFIGLGASVIHFVAACMIVGRPSSIASEELIGESGLLPILLRLRRSFLPETLDLLVNDQAAQDEHKFRQYGTRVNVHMFHDGQLVFVNLDLQKRPL